MALTVSLWVVRPSGTVTAPVQPLLEGFLQRCGRTLPASMKTFRTEAALLGAVAAERKQVAAVFWAADLGGRDFGSEAFAKAIGRARDAGTRHLMLAVGPANGWSDDARKAADLRLSLSTMTLPHELAALVLAEQIYRASTILQGHPYHLGH